MVAAGFLLGKASMTREKILVVDDEPDIRAVLVGLLKQAGYESRGVASGEEALEEVMKDGVELVITDLKMEPKMSGLVLLEHLAQKAPEVPAIMITAFGTVANAVEAMKAGAKEFVQKPFDRDEVLVIVDRVLDAHVRGRKQPPERRSGGLESTVMKQCRENMTRAAKSNATVLLRGENGAGKEVAAEAIHRESGRAKGPFVPVNCSAIPETLIESELFGYEPGAFTGATKRKPGLVELANGGTLFLDEIGDLQPHIQVKLLRLLAQKGEFQRLGGTRVERSDVRFICATNRNLEDLVKQGKFREDFFFRINVIPIVVPPLRERREDIAPLARRFCRTAAEENGKEIELSPEAIAALEKQSWPGNVRELQNFVERLVVFSDGETIGLADAERELARVPQRASGPTAGTLVEARNDAEKQRILDALSRAKGNRSLAARLLEISRRTLYNKMDELGIGK
jgi:two-component system response regulator AtoC